MASVERPDDTSEYRAHLVGARQQAQADYDKTLFALSGGALGVSFAFVGNFIKTEVLRLPWFLYLAWGCWVTSVTMVLASYYLSRLTLDRALDDLDEGKLGPTPGGALARWTEFLNVFGAVLFIIGLGLMLVFIINNQG